MVDVALLLIRMPERRWRELFHAYSIGDILTVGRLVYKHLQADLRRKEKLSGIKHKPHTNVTNEFKTVEDLEKLWKS